ncbi:urease [Gammaproteobacteria bacterium 42_54_T18]|nr:urease [Gammaproteobacteria bacterium 42_54_T18]
MKSLITLGLTALLAHNSSFAENAAPTAPLASRALINGNIYTANDAQPYAEAIAIHNGKVIAVGSFDEIKSVIGIKTNVTDLKGKQVLPGFIDNHNHIFEAASEAGGNCELSQEATPSEQIPYLQTCFENSKPGQWVVGWGHTIQATLTLEEEDTPLEIIDSIFPDRPVIIMEQTSHSMWVNSIALALAGITLSTPDPQGGKIMKTEDADALLGILIDNAGDIVMELAWNSLKNKFTKSYDGLLNGLHEVAKNGITTVGDGRLYWKRGWYDVWKAAEADGQLTARVSLRPWIYPHIPQKEQLSFLESIYNPNKNTLLIVDQVKIYSDGIIVNGTAKTLAPYQFTYFPKSPYGLNYIQPKAMKNWLTTLATLGYGAHIHAIGDGGVRDALDAIESARRSGLTHHYNITHLEMVNSADYSRFKSLSVDADFQVGSDYIVQNDHSWAHELIGEKRSHKLIPLGTIYKTGANITLSSDWNVNPLSPLSAIANAVELKDKGLPTVQAAIDAYTINAAHALGLEPVTGSIEVGKSADIVVLDRAIVGGTPQNIVIWTLLRGKTVFKEGS